MFRVRHAFCAALALMVAFQATVPCCALAPRTEQCRCCTLGSTAGSQCSGSQKRWRTERDRQTPSTPQSEVECPFCAGTADASETKDDARTRSSQLENLAAAVNSERPAIEANLPSMCRLSTARLQARCDLLTLQRLLL